MGTILKRIEKAQNEWSPSTTGLSKGRRLNKRKYVPTTRPGDAIDVEIESLGRKR